MTPANTALRRLAVAGGLAAVAVAAPILVALGSTGPVTTSAEGKCLCSAPLVQDLYGKCIEAVAVTCPAPQVLVAGVCQCPLPVSDGPPGAATTLALKGPGAAHCQAPL